MDDGMKEVYFNEYCPKCRHWEKPEHEEPCDTCLTEPGNKYSHRPVEFMDSGKWNNKES